MSSHVDLLTKCCKGLRLVSPRVWWTEPSSGLYNACSRARDSRDAMHSFTPCLLHFYINTYIWWHHTWLFLLFLFVCFHFSSPLQPLQHPPPPKILLGVTDINKLICLLLLVYFSPYRTSRLIHMYVSAHVHKWEGCFSLFYMVGLYFRCFKSWSILLFSFNNTWWKSIQLPWCKSNLYFLNGCTLFRGVGVL